MRQYEITYLISDEVPEGELNKVTGKVGGYITELGGKATKEEIWGRRKLAYPIQKQEFATYVTLLFNLPGEKVASLERLLKHYNKVIRHLLIVKDYGSEELTLSTEEIAETADIEEVIGGERSFEAIEGETEESYDLHSKRKEGGEEEVEEPEVKEEEKKQEIESSKETKEEKTEEVAEVKEPAGAEATKETKEEKKEEKPKAKPKAKKEKKDGSAKEKAEKEAERLSKLDEELDQILGDDL